MGISQNWLKSMLRWKRIKNIHFTLATIIKKIHYYKNKLSNPWTKYGTKYQNLKKINKYPIENYIHYTLQVLLYFSVIEPKVKLKL